jgi:hypothetical protein
MAACKSCERPIVWAVGPGNKMMPFDEPPRGFGAKAPDGDWVVAGGKARRATDDDRRLHRERLTCHFATCPDADTWRKPR